MSVGVSPYTVALAVVVVVVACHSLRNCRASRRSALASKDRMYTRQWSHLSWSARATEVVGEVLGNFESAVELVVDLLVRV